MKVIICQDEEQIAREAYKIVQDRVMNRNAKVLGLATGSSPLGLYRELVEGFKRGEIDFSDVHTFNLDEYVGLPETHPQSCRRFMYENLFNYINLKKANISFPDGMTMDMEDECMRYEEAIEDLGGVKLQIIGIGRDGHIGFNEPGSSLTSRTHVITLAQTTINDNARFFGGDASAVPHWAVTMGIGTILDAREIIMLANGENKADAIKGMLEGPITTMNAASALQLHNQVTVIMDESAASKLSNREYYDRTAASDDEAMYKYLREARKAAGLD